MLTWRQKTLERETGIEPATNSLEGCDSTTELLPLLNPAISYQPSALSYKPWPRPPISIRSTIFTTEIVEPMTRIELVTSPLPRECSTN
jgi:hypothetical protein